MTGPAPALRLSFDHVRELKRVLANAAEHLAHGRLSHPVLYDLHYQAARLELALEQAHMPHRDSKEPPR